jgi:hypothetical protein
MPEYLEFIDVEHYEECEMCIYFIYGECKAEGETSTEGDCPSFKDD